MGTGGFQRAALATVVTLLMAAGTTTMSAAAGASFEGNLAFDNAAGCGWLTNMQATVSVEDPIQQPIFMQSTPTDPNGCFLIGFPFDLQPNFHITVTDGFNTKDVTLVDLSINGIDDGANMVGGSAPPNTLVHVDADTCGNDNCWEGLEVMSQPDGLWFADFNTIGVDILPCMHVGADISDTDGDQTATDRQDCDPGPGPGNQPDFTDPGSFGAAIAALGTPKVVDFEDQDPLPGNSLEGRPEFDPNTYADQGISFEQPNDVPLYIAPGGLTDCDAGDVPDGPECHVWNESNSLSVGEFPFPADVTDDNDDDLVVRVDPPMQAVAFTLVDTGGGGPDEFIQFLDADGGLLAQFSLPGQFQPFRSFAGFISDGRPIAAINIVEAQNDGDDVAYDDFILVPPPTPDFTPSAISVTNEPLSSDLGVTPVFSGWARTIHVDVTNVGGAAGDASLDVWVTTNTDGVRTYIGSKTLQLGPGRTVRKDIAWNGFGALGDVTIEAITCSPRDENPENDKTEASHDVIVGGTAFGVTGPVTFGGVGTPTCGS